MKKSDVSRCGFTLIELLVVVLIIMILSGMLFKIAGMVTGKAARSKAITDIENLANALNEYYVEYGMYPPTSGNAYVFENRGYQTEALQVYLAEHNDPAAGADDFVADMEGRDPPYDSTIGAIGYEYGLVSYLWERDQGQGRWDPDDTSEGAHWYDQDSDPRDIQAKARWAHYLDGFDLSSGIPVMPPFQLPESEQLYANSSRSVKDPWEKEYDYSSQAPYQTYTLYSYGPNTIANDGDDIHHDSYSE